MQYRTLGKTTFQVSSIGMGCVTFGREIGESDSFQVLDRARERGINLFDTAPAYAAGASESVLGRWLFDRRLREDVVLATKVNGVLSKEQIRSSVDESLGRLRTDRIDLLQLHHWDEQTPLPETMAGLDDVVESGKVACVGCSNWTHEQMNSALMLSQQQGLVEFQSVQPPYNLVQREIEAELLPLCQQARVAVLSYSPLGAGFLTGKYRRDQRVPPGTRFDVIPGHQPIYFTEEGFRALERLESASRTSGHSMVRLALAWVLSRPRLTSVLIGARNPDQVDQVFAAEEAAEAAEVMQLLEGL